MKDANDIVKSEIKEMKDIFSQNEPLVDTVKKNTVSVQKMHGTTLKSYAHFASKTDDLKIQTDTKISNVISSIQDLKDETNFEMRELSKKLDLLLQSKNSDNTELPPPSGHTINNI